MMVVIRYISKVLVWILSVLVVIGSVGNRQDVALKWKVSQLRCVKVTIDSLLSRGNRRPLVALRGPQEGPREQHPVGPREGSGVGQRKGPAGVRDRGYGLHGRTRCGSTARLLAFMSISCLFRVASKDRCTKFALICVFMSFG